MTLQRGLTQVEPQREAIIEDNPDKVPPDQAGAGENLCRACEGTGRIDGEECRECGGTGKVGTPIGGA
jgi:RecJ-like exonuclease